MNKLLKHELIGLHVKVADSPNRTLIGLEGKIVDESRNMIIIGNKQVMKSQVVLDVQFEGSTVRVDGKKLVARPEERLKKK